MDSKWPVTFRIAFGSVKGILQDIQESEASQRPIRRDIVTTGSGLSTSGCATDRDNPAKTFVRASEVFLHELSNVAGNA